MTRAGAGEVYMLSKTLTWPGLQRSVVIEPNPSVLCSSISVHRQTFGLETVALCLKGDTEVHQYEDDLAELVSGQL